MAASCAGRAVARRRLSGLAAGPAQL